MNIKLRSWDGVKLSYSKTEFFDDSVNFRFDHFAVDGVKPLLDRFTGELDNHGKDIYEGDKISDHNGFGIVKYSDKDCAFYVSYGDGTAKWFYDYSLKGEKESIEVIGNIHEEPTC